MAMISEESTTCNAEVKWFFDSGCSQHMTGNEQLLHGLEFSPSRRVMLGDGSYCVVRGQGMTTDANQPALEKVQLVEGLRANLISISRLCDDGYEVSFTNSICTVLDAQQNIKFTGIRTKNHCYEWISNGEGPLLREDRTQLRDTSDTSAVQQSNLIPTVLEEIQRESSVSLTAEARPIAVTGPQQFVKQETYRSDWQNTMQDEVRQLRAHERDTNEAHWRNSPRLTVMQESVIRKTYLIAQGYEEVEGVSLNELFPPRSFLDVITFLVGAACALSAKLYRLDAVSSELDIYRKLMNSVLDLGYTRGSVNKSLFTQGEEQDISIVYINGSHLIGLTSCQTKIDLLFTTLGQQLDVVYHGELTEIFGLQVQQLEEGIFLTQSEYIRQLMIRFSMEGHSSVRTPIRKQWNQLQNEDGEEINQTVYMEMIGSLEFVTATRPDIVLAVGICSGHQDTPRIHHFRAVKRILKYLKGTLNLGLYFNKLTDKHLSGYASAYQTRMLNEHRNVCGGCFFLGDNLLSWYNKARSVLSSPTENNSAAVGICALHLVRLNQLLNECGMTSNTPLLHCDDRSAINVIMTNSNQTEHIDVFDEYVHAQIVANKVVVRPVSNALLLSDLLSKPHNPEQLVFLRQAVGLIEL